MSSITEPNSSDRMVLATLFRKSVRLFIFQAALVIFLFTGWIYKLNGQENRSGQVSGVVYDEILRKPLSDANIYLEKLKMGTSSGSDGKFSIINVPEGHYNLTVSFLGFQRVEQKITVSPGETTDLIIYLEKQVFTKGEVVIRTSRNKEENEAPLRIDIIPVKKIEQAPVLNVPSVLDYVSGINMNNTFGIYSGRAVVTMRGLPANDQSRTLVLLDDIPLNKADEGSVNWNMINKNNIESIKVIKGPGPAEYGSGAMGGVIEMKSRKPEEKLTGKASVGYGTYNTFDANIDFSGFIRDSTSVNGLYWGLSAFGRKSDGYITEPEEFYEEGDTILVPTFLKEINTSAKIGYDFKNRQSLELKFSYFDDKRGNGVKVFEDYGAFSEHDTYSSVVKYSGFQKHFRWKTYLFYTYENYQRMYEYMNEGEYQLYEADSRRNDMGGQFILSSGKYRNNNLTGGVDYKFGSVDGVDTYYTSTDIISNAGRLQIGAIFVQDEIFMLSRKLQVNLGIRYDFARYSNGLYTIDYPSYSIEFVTEFEDEGMPEKYWDAFCPRLSIQYLFAGDNRTFFSVAKGFRAPILDDMTRTGKKKGTFKVANPDLNPELITSIEWGADYEIIRDLMLTGSVYYSLGQDFMYYSSTGDSVNMGYKIVPVLIKKNISKVTIYGVETELKYELNQSFSAFANYAYTHAMIKKNEINDPAVDYDLSGKFLTDIPDHKVSAGFNWYNRIVNFTLMYKFIGEQWINDLNVIEDEYLLTDKYPAYSIFSVRFEKQIVRHLKISLNIENIFDKIYTDSNAQQCPGRFIMGSVYFNL